MFVHGHECIFLILCLFFVGTFAFDATATELGFNKFMLLSDLNDPYTGFVVDDFMIVEAEFSPIFYAKNGAINRLPLASSTVHHA